MNAVRQSFRPKHQVLVLKCYPKFQKNATDVKPNGSELSSVSLVSLFMEFMRLLFYLAIFSTMQVRDGVKFRKWGRFWKRRREAMYPGEESGE